MKKVEDKKEMDFDETDKILADPEILKSLARRLEQIRKGKLYFIDEV